LFYDCSEKFFNEVFFCFVEFNCLGLSFFLFDQFVKFFFCHWRHPTKWLYRVLQIYYKDKNKMKTLQIFFLLFLTICLSGCYQRFYCELKSDHLLVSAVDGRSYSKLSMSKIESDFDKICEKHKLDFYTKNSFWGHNYIFWSNGKRSHSITAYAESKKYTRISFSCRKVDVSRMQSIINDFKSYLQRNNIAFKEKHYTQWKSEIYLLN